MNLLLLLNVNFQQVWRKSKNEPFYVPFPDGVILKVGIAAAFIPDAGTLSRWG